jgi:hypothetical protein
MTTKESSERSMRRRPGCMLVTIVLLLVLMVSLVVCAGGGWWLLRGAAGVNAEGLSSVWEKIQKQLTGGQEGMESGRADVTPGTGVGGKLYDHEKFSFRYPDEWHTVEETWPEPGTPFDVNFQAEELGGVIGRDEGYAACRVYEKPIPEGEELADVLEVTYAEMMTEVVDVREGSTELDGMPALEKVYKQPWGEPWYQVWDVWVEQDGTAYVVSCKTYPNSFDGVAEDFRAIMDTFHLK